MKRNIAKNIAKELNTIQDIIRWSISQFNSSDIYYGHGADNSIDETLHLVLTSLFLPLDTPYKIWNSRITFEERYLIVKRIIRRITERIPVSYLINKAWFCDYEFYVDNRVFIPRSPISELINTNFSGIISFEPKTILDMCTGSGCIAISCAYKFPNSQIDAVDISLDALQVVEKNIEIHQCFDRVIPIYSNLFENINLSFKYDLIISNPPYVSSSDILKLPKEYCMEPIISLKAGDDGLKFIENILINAPFFLKENGVIICEVGNKKLSLIKKFPDIPFLWINFKNGGDGVFVLTYKQLVFYEKLFKLSCNFNN